MKDFFETVKWFARTALDVSSIIVLIICLCTVDCESLWLPAISAIASAAWIGYRLYSSEQGEKDGEHDVQD